MCFRIGSTYLVVHLRYWSIPRDTVDQDQIKHDSPCIDELCETVSKVTNTRKDEFLAVLSAISESLIQLFRLCIHPLLQHPRATRSVSVLYFPKIVLDLL